MKKLKKLFRLLGLSCLIALAMFGVGFAGALFANNHEQLRKRSTVERKDEDNDQEELIKR